MTLRPVRYGYHNEARATDVRVRMPLLDRLLDDAPKDTEDTPLNLAAAQLALHDAVRRDLEGLLNARRPWRALPAGHQALQTSPIGYGLNDFAAGAFNDAQARQRLRAEIAEIIARFEPRLTEVVVELADAAGADATLRLRIRGMILAEPAPEPVEFTTFVHPATADVEVQ